MIGHLKAEHRMGRNHLAHRTDDAINAMLAAPFPAQMAAALAVQIPGGSKNSGRPSTDLKIDNFTDD